MQRWLFVPLSLLLLTLIGCKMSSMPAQRPDDFAVAYDWREGSLPPPYHYEYSITLNDEGLCEIIMMPGYDRAEVPRWEERFEVPAADRDRLYQQFLDLGLFTQSWREASELRVGGSTQWMTVVANGTQVKLPAQVVESQEAAAEQIYAAVHAIIPPEIWNKLQDQLKQYQEENQP